MPDQTATQPAASLDAVLRTPELGRRAPRLADHRAESQALLRLAGHLAESPRTILPAMAEITLELLGVGSSGISLLRSDGSGFWWPAIAGAWQPYTGGGLPRDASPCGVVLDTGRTQLFAHPEQYFQDIGPAEPRIEEVLLVPFRLHGKVVGTVWALSHDAARRFDGEDERLLTSVAAFASAAWQALGSLDALDAEQARLRDGEDRLAFALEASHIGAWDMDLATQTIVRSIEHDRLFGHGDAPEGWTFGDLLAHVVPADRERVAASFGAALAGEADWNVECRIRRADGDVRWIVIAARRRDQGGHMVGVVRDVTAQKLAEEAARTSQLQLHEELAAMTRLHELVSRLLVCPDLSTALQEVLDATIELNGADKGNVQLVNEDSGALEIVAHRGFGREFLDFFKEVRVDADCACGQAMRSGRSVVIADVMADEAFAPFRGIAVASGFRAVQATPLLGAGGRLLGIMSTHWAQRHLPSARDRRMTDLYARQVADFIERMRTDAALRKSAVSLAQADRRKDEFLATLAHELRNPLGPIRHAATLTKMPQATREQIKWAQDVIDRQVGHMARLLDDLLEVSRITRGTLELRKERLRLGENLIAASETVRPLIEARGHRLRVNVPQEEVFVDADPVRFAQIFTNLLSNAAKYTDAGGLIELDAIIAGADAVVRVRDNGIGISAELLPRIFEMFSQAASALNRSEGGLGIGLSLVRGLVLLHGGAIDAHSEGLGHGSEFIVTLPLVAAGGTGDAGGASAGNEGATESLRVLVVDDNRDHVDGWVNLLELDGHVVRGAYSGTQALRLATEFQPQLVLLDIGMPDLNGYEVARRMREATWGADMVLVAVSGWSQAEDKRQAEAAGFDGHLAKPASRDALEPMIGLAQDRKRALARVA
ncbi:MAG TPA: GAF domain-containing protein [Burkholderiaceae bacterium]|nr:GAF domain-containing protein [Burkholderiaceae bacterium]